jgi:hypothetical protein
MDGATGGWYVLRDRLCVGCAETAVLEENCRILSFALSLLLPAKRMFMLSLILRDHMPINIPDAVRRNNKHSYG